jgi:isopenicillin N synthase-like dioxygenase
MTIYSYKCAGAYATDETGAPDSVEFINIAKDDAIVYPKVARQANYPSTVVARMENTIIPFVHKSLGVNNTVLAVLGERLGLPEGKLEEFHSLMEHSGSEARAIKNPKNQAMPQDKAALGAHTDFGSLVS